MNTTKIKIISIHAPTRGATAPLSVFLCVLREFQFTPPRGGRRTSKCPAVPTRAFQFTPPRGGRHRALLAPATSTYFNSRPRAGGDLVPWPECVKADGFQFTPPRGGRPVAFAQAAQKIAISIHAPARGATRKIATAMVATVIFQFTPPRGGRLGCAEKIRIRSLFQFTPPRGGRRR